MPVQEFTDAVEIEGSNDTIQLKVEGHTTQTAPLQVWVEAANDPLLEPVARVTGDGRFQIGSFDSGAMATDDSLIEAHRDESDTSKPKRGLHLRGSLTGTLSSLVAWVVHELFLKGSSGISALHSALRVKLTNENTGTMTSARLWAGEFEVVNAGGSSGSPVTEMVGVHAKVTNQSGAYLDTAYGVKVEMDDEGTLETAYAIHTDAGLVHIGSVLEIAEQDAPAAAAGVMRIYPKSDGKLYAKNPAGTEIELGGGGGSGIQPVAEGGTGADLSSSGGTGQYVKQVTAGGTFTVGVIAEADVPSLPASKIGSGTLSEARIGAFTNIDVNGGAIDNTIIGGTVAAAGTFTQMVINATSTTPFSINRQGWSSAYFNNFSSTNDYDAGHLTFQRARNTQGSPQAVAAFDRLAGFTANGHNGTGFQLGADVLIYTNEAWSGSQNGTVIYFRVTPQGTTSAATIASITGEGVFAEKNLVVGTTSPGTSANHTLVIATGTAPTSSPADAIQLYASGANAELRVRDELGNITPLSAHQSERVETTNRPTAYVYRDYNVFSGKKVELDIYGALQALEAVTGKQFIYVDELPAAEREDWDANERLKQAQREREIAEWQHKKAAYDQYQQQPDAERDNVAVVDPGQEPQPYVVQPKPNWLNDALPGADA